VAGFYEKIWGKTTNLTPVPGLTLRQLGAHLEVSNTFVLSLEQGKKKTTPQRF
jgi:hypothetical protein